MTWDRYETSLPNVGIQAVAAAEASAASSAEDAGPMMGAAGGAGMSRGGGLLGRASSSAGGTVVARRARPAALDRSREVEVLSRPVRGDVRLGHCRDAHCRQ